MDKEEVKQLNQGYSITEKDLKEVEDLINLIETTRSNSSPKVGDIVKFTSEHGDYYESAVISRIEEDGDIEICEHYPTPFVKRCNSKTKNIWISISGGPFCSIKADMFKYIGKDKSKFCYSEICEAKCFFATVNVWEVKQKNRYEPYTTEKYNKMYIYKNVEDFNPYTILGKGIAFTTEREYNIFLKTYRAKEFATDDNNVFVIFYYKEENFYISKNEWDNLQNCEIDTRLYNGSIITVKVQYDDINKKIKVYKYSNSFEPNEEIADKPYILNR